jgi:phage tail sheath protein FI
MPFQLSPGVNVSEIDLTTVIPAVATTDAGIGGVFRWGPVEKTLMVTNEDELVNRYGRPTSLNAETFFTAASFLAYSNRLHVSRAAHTTGNTYNVTAVLETGNTAITITPTNTNIVVGDAVFGEGISEGTTIAAIVNATAGEFTLSVAAETSDVSDIQIFDADYCFNAIANTNNANLAGQIVKNEDDYETATFDDDVQWVAKYPGLLGNSLKISVCDSATSFQSNTDLAAIDEDDELDTIDFTIEVGSNTAVIYAANSSTGTANSSAAAITTAVTNLQVGDVIKLGNSVIGFEYLTITNIGEVEKLNDGALDTGEASVTIQFDDRFSLALDYTTTTIERFWEFWDVVDAPPGQSTFQLQQGNTAASDELHVVVSDEDGRISGVPGTILEVFQGLSRATDSKTEDSATNYYKEVVNQSSKYVWWAGDVSGAESAIATQLASSSNIKPYTKSFVGGRDTKSEANLAIADLINAYNEFKSSEDIDISLLLTGKSRGGAHGQQLANYLIDNIAEKRMDCVVFVSPDRGDVVENAGGDIEQDVVQFRNAMRSTSYAVLDSGYKYMYDKYNDVYRWIPINGDTAGLCARTDDLRDPWWSPAGFNRGQIRNVVKLAWNPNKAQRDILYKNGVNPIVNFPGQGIIMFGDKTLLAKPSAFDRINVRRLFIVLEKAISVSAKFTLFEFNDEFTRASFVNLVTPFLRDVQGRRGITDFVVICDDTNNTGEVIDRNEFIGDIYIKPARSINFIQLNFVAVRTGVEFSEVIGNF